MEMDTPVSLEAKDVAATYGDGPVNQPVSLVLRSGELGLIMGANGSGKTSLLGTFVGLVNCASGSVCILGRTPVYGRTWELMRQPLRVVPQFPVLPLFLTVKEYLASWFACTHQLIGLSSRHKQSLCAVQTEIVELLRISSHIPIGHLSFGQRKLVEILLAIHARPRLILADEPLAGIARSLIPTVVDLLGRFVAEGGSVLMVAHRPEHGDWSPTWVREVFAIRSEL